jgi:nitrogen fixation protein FixH
MKRSPWPIGLTIFLVSFVVLVVVGAVVVGRMPVHMVTDRPYEKGLAFADRMEAIRRTRDLARKPEIVLDAAARLCELRFPDTLVSDVEGTARFYRPDDPSRDVEYPVRPSSDGTQRFDVSGFSRGAWALQVDWKRAGVEYYIEERLYFP